MSITITNAAGFLLVAGVLCIVAGICRISLKWQGFSFTLDKLRGNILCGFGLILIAAAALLYGRMTPPPLLVIQ
ncbi:MAG: hypothetical protein WCU88_10355 [Elusimicrobiota bacterium]|jgi:hypothetical protein